MACSTNSPTSGQSKIRWIANAVCRSIHRLNPNLPQSANPVPMYSITKRQQQPTAQPGEFQEVVVEVLRAWEHGTGIREWRIQEIEAAIR